MKATLLEKIKVMQKDASFWGWLIASVLVPLLAPIILALIAYGLVCVFGGNIKEGVPDILYILIASNCIFVFFGADTLTASFEPRISRFIYRKIPGLTLRGGQGKWAKTTTRKSVFIASVIVCVVAAILFMNSFLNSVPSLKWAERLNATILGDFGYGTKAYLIIHVILLILSITLLIVNKADSYECDPE